MIEWWWHFHINFDFLNVELDVSGEVIQEIEKTKPTTMYYYIGFKSWILN